MDELRRNWVRRFTIFVFISIGVGDTVTPVWAGQAPQPLPAYSDVENLHGDSSLTAVAFSDPRSESAGTGIVVGDRGTVYRSTDRGETWSFVPSPVDCRLKDVIWIGSRTVVIVGGAYDALTQLSRGVVLISRDAGASFRQINDHDLPLLRTIRLSDNRLLVADGDWSHAQMSRSFDSRDGGQSWQGRSDQMRSDQRHSDQRHSDQRHSDQKNRDQGSRDQADHDRIHGESAEVFDSAASSSTSDEQTQSATSFVRWQRITGALAPVRDVCRVADDRICAVGDHGLILTSDEDGETWVPRQGGDRHAAILFVAGDARLASWSLLGAEALQWRHRCALLIEHPMESKAIKNTSDSERTLELVRQAGVMLGAASIDWFRGADEADEPTDLQARRWIAVHRPSVVVIDESVSDETRQAVFQAAASMGVSRILKASRKEHGGSLLHHSALLPRIGLLAADLTLDAQHLVAPQRCEPSSLSLTRLYDSGSSRIGGGGESIMAGLNTSQTNQLGGIAKSISRHRLQVVQARMKQQQLIGQLVDAEKTSSVDFRRSLRQLIDQTASEDQLRLVWSVLKQTQGVPGTQNPHQTQVTRLEQLCLREIADRFHDHSIGKWASVRIGTYRTSAEHQSLKSIADATNEIVRVAPTQSAAVAISPFQNMDAEPEVGFQQDAFQQGMIQQAAAAIPVGVGRPEVIQASPVSAQTPSKASVDLQFDLHPAVMLSRIEATQEAGSREELLMNGATDAGMTTAGDLQRIALQGTADWRRLLRNPGDAQFQHQGWAKRTSTPPHLDGKLSDPCWDSRNAVVVQGDYQLRFAFDQNYLYVAAVCSGDAIAKDAVQRTVGGTSRDQSLLDVDRLQLRLDTDGDLWTSYWIEVSDAGRTRDAIDGNTSWQPTWYVDIERTEQTLTFELAIRRSDLVGDLDNFGEAGWFVSARTIKAQQEITEPLFPQPSHWRSIRFGQPDDLRSDELQPGELQQQKLRPAGPVRLAPVEPLR